MTASISPAAASAERQMITLPIAEGLTCFRGLSPKRSRFELEYALERGSTANSFLFAAGPDTAEVTQPAVLVHPPGAAYASVFLPVLQQALPDPASKLVVVVGLGRGVGGQAGGWSGGGQGGEDPGGAGYWLRGAPGLDLGMVMALQLVPKGLQRAGPDELNILVRMIIRVTVSLEVVVGGCHPVIMTVLSVTKVQRLVLMLPDITNCGHTSLMITLIVIIITFTITITVREDKHQVLEQLNIPRNLAKEVQLYLN